MTEYREKKYQEKVEQKEKRQDEIRNWKYRREMRRFIDDKMKLPTQIAE